jgi:hypothetical protein
MQYNHRHLGRQNSLNEYWTSLEYLGHCQRAIFCGKEVQKLVLLTKTIGILHPIHSISCSSRSSVYRDIADIHVSAVHYVQTPQRRVLDEETGQCYIANIPENHGHRATGLGDCLLDAVPCISVTVDPSGSMAIDANVVACDHKPSGMILICDGVAVCAPIGEVIR